MAFIIGVLGCWSQFLPLYLSFFSLSIRLLSPHFGLSLAPHAFSLPVCFIFFSLVIGDNICNRHVREWNAGWVPLPALFRRWQANIKKINAKPEQPQNMLWCRERILCAGSNMSKNYEMCRFFYNRYRISGFCPVNFGSSPLYNVHCICMCCALRMVAISQMAWWIHHNWLNHKGNDRLFAAQSHWLFIPWHIARQTI